MRGNRVPRQPVTQANNGQGMLTVIVVAILILFGFMAANSVPAFSHYMDGLWAYVGIFAAGIVIGGLSAVQLMHYKEAGAVGRSINHVTGAVSRVTVSSEATKRKEFDTLNKDKQRLAAREAELRRRERQCDKREANLSATESDIKRMVQAAIDEFKNSMRIAG